MTRPQIDHEDGVDIAKQLFAEGKIQEAIDLLDTVPESPEALKTRAQLLATLGRNDEAIECFEAVIRRSPDDASTLSNLAAFLIDQGRYAKAVEAYDRAICLDSQAPVIKRDRALALRLNKDYEAALVAYDDALAIDNEDADTWAAKADLLIERQRFSEAIECLDHASKALSGTWSGNEWTIRGYSLTNADAFDEAIYCFDRAMDQDPGNTLSALLGKASVLERSGKVNDALDCYERATKDYPEDERSWARKGDILAMRGDLEEALKCYKAALELDSEDIQSTANLGYCHFELGHHNRALQDYSDAIDLDSGYAVAWEGKGRCLESLGLPNDSVWAYKKAVEIDPHLIWANNNLGWVLSSSFQMHEEALEYFDRAIDLGPAEPAPAINKAKALVELERVGEARELLEATLENVNEEDRWAVLWSMGLLYSEQLNDSSQALELFEQAEQLGPIGLRGVLGIAEILIRLDRREEAKERISGVLVQAVEPKVCIIANFLLFVSHALEGNLEKATGCFSDFIDILADSAELDDDNPELTTWEFDGLTRFIVNSSVNLATKFEILVTVDLIKGQLVGPSVAKLRESLPVIGMLTTVAPPLLGEDEKEDGFFEFLGNIPNWARKAFGKDQK